MAFTIRNLHVLTYASGFTVWAFNASKNTRTEIEAPGFFDPAQDMMVDGDHVHVYAPTWGGLARVWRKDGVVHVSMMEAA